MKPTRRQRQREVKRQLRAGYELAFSPVDVLGNKTLSHTIRRTPKGYIATMADGVELGPFHTFAAAERAAEAHQRGTGH